MGGVNLEILDCTLRDGNHAISGGFKPEMAAHIIGGLLDAGVEVIEFGRASGIGSKAGNITDEKYLAAATPYLGRGEIGMFYRPELFGDCQYQLASESKLAFLRVGTHAGSVENSAKTLSSIRKMGIKARYSLIQAHMLSPSEIAESGRKVESYGAQSINFKIGLHSEPKDTWNNFWHAVVFSAMSS